MNELVLTEWKEIKGTGRCYSISSRGQVRNNNTKQILKVSKHGSVVLPPQVKKGEWKRRNLSVSKLQEEYYGVTKMSSRGNRPVKAVDGATYKVYPSIYAATKEGFNAGGIARSLKTGIRHGGYIWEYA